MMYKTNRWTRRVSAVGALAAAGALAFSGVAFADNIQDDIVDTGSVALVAGSTTTGTANIKVVGNGNDGTTTDAGCNWDPGEAPLVLNVITPAGVTANPNPVSITTCGVDVPVAFKASTTAVSGVVTVTIASQPAGGGGYSNQVSIPITVNHKPSVSVSGVADGANYVVGSVPKATCDVTDAEDGPSSFDAVLSGTLTNGLGQQTATCNYTDTGGLKADTASVAYNIVAPPNTKPSVAVTGVTDGANYEIGSVPTAKCDVKDTEDGNSTKNAVLSGTLSHGLGTQTATCDYTDKGGLAADTAIAIYKIVDTGNPTIHHSLVDADGNPITANGNASTTNGNGWYNQDVTVHFTCADSGSGVQSCLGDKTLGEGADQSVTGTATDWAGNTATDTVDGINIDETNPVVGFKGGPAATYFFGNDPAAPTCEASDALSGVDGTCAVTGGGTTVGDHTYTATATDNAGNQATATLNYTVLPWSLKGFYQPVDMSSATTTIWNTVKGGSTVPLKFEAFAGSELTDTSAVKSFTQKQVTCPGASAITDAIELTTTGGTSLRYDTTAGQFVQNWATPKKPGTCYTTTMTTQDGSSISANFSLK